MPRLPDIVWIVTTQWRGQALGFAGDPNARTPHLERFAERAIHYTQAVTPHPFGPFARAALLSGKPSPANGVRDYYDPLPEGSRTIAHALNEVGYDTAWFGKWHLSPRDPAAPLVGEPHARQPVLPGHRGGFGHWEGFESGFLLNDPWLQGDGIGEPRRFEGYQSEVLVDRFLGWHATREGATRPGFTVLSLEAPHPPYAAPAAGLTPPDPASLTLRGNVPPGGEVEEKARRELSGYYAHIEATDRALGRVLAHPALEQAVVIVTSVHGDMHGSHGLFRKGWPHEESLRVPLLVRLPSFLRRFPFGVASSDLVSLLEVHDWTLRLAGLGGPAQRTPRLVQRCSMPSVVKLPLQCDREWTAYRGQRRKLVLNANGSPWLYFDLEQDPLELRNLAPLPEWSAELAEFRQACEEELRRQEG
jgi:arylsulfatase A-like enzyme